MMLSLRNAVSPVMYWSGSPSARRLMPWCMASSSRCSSGRSRLVNRSMRSRPAALQSSHSAETRGCCTPRRSKNSVVHSRHRPIVQGFCISSAMLSPPPLTSRRFYRNARAHRAVARCHRPMRIPYRMHPTEIQAFLAQTLPDPCRESGRRNACPARTPAIARKFRYQWFFSAAIRHNISRCRCRHAIVSAALTSSRTSPHANRPRAFINKVVNFTREGRSEQRFVNRVVNFVLEAGGTGTRSRLRRFWSLQIEHVPAIPHNIGDRCRWAHRIDQAHT